jgi:hypothetical protein
MDRENISTENQLKGSARNQSDTLDRQDEDVARGQREWADDSKKNPDPASKSPMEDLARMAAPAALAGRTMSRSDSVASRPPDELPPEMPENPDPGADTPDGPPVEANRDPAPLTDQVRLATRITPGCMPARFSGSRVSSIRGQSDGSAV